MADTNFDGYIYCFSVDYESVNVNEIQKIHSYLMKKNNIV